MAAFKTLKSGSVPNVERSGATRARLLGATIDIIAANGWTSASTAKICKKAGVSRGAQTHHYPTRNDLMLAAVSENSRRYKDLIEAETPGLIEQGDSLRTYLELLWEACFEEEFVRSWMEVMVAARTDADLIDAVQKLDASAMKFMREVTQSFTKEEYSTEQAADMIELSVMLLRGMIIQDGIHRNRDHLRHLFGKWLDIISKNLLVKRQ